MKGSGCVFGTYTHCSWPVADGTVADPSGKSCIFLLVNVSRKAVRFGIQDKDRAIEVHGIGLFCGTIKMEGDRQTGWPNFVLMHNGLAADQKDANIANSIDATKAYQPDDGQVCGGSFLAGQPYFAADEIEVFQL